MATTLSTYITQVQRFLHDQNGNFWPVPELIDYINEARNRICSDSKCLRHLETGIPLVAGQEVYSVQTILPNQQNTVVDVMGITLYWGTERIKMGYRPFTQLDAEARSWQTYQTRPVLFSRMGATQVYVAPIPDQAYITDWDVAVIPAPLVNTTDVEVIPPPFTAPVKYYACYLAKFKEQAMGESKMFKDMYNQQGLAAARSFMTRAIPNPYSR